MLYVINFSHTGSSIAKGWEVNHGHTTCVQEADSPDDATDKCKILLRRLTRERYLLDPGAKVYLDSCVEILQVPPEGLVTFAASRQGKGGSKICISLPGAPVGAGNNYDDGDEAMGPALTIPTADSSDK